LKVRIYVGEPADATTGNVFEVLAARIEELIISLFIADASNSVRALRFDIRNPLIGRRPAILVQVYLLSRTVADKVIQVAENVRPRILTPCGVPGKEWKHVGINHVNSVENGLGT